MVRDAEVEVHHVFAIAQVVAAKVETQSAVDRTVHVARRHRSVDAVGGRERRRQVRTVGLRRPVRVAVRPRAARSVETEDRERFHQRVPRNALNAELIVAVLVQIACVLAVDLIRNLVRATNPDVVREETVGRGAAAFDLRLMVEGRSANTGAECDRARIRSGLDDLIDVPAQRRRRSRSRTAAGVHFGRLSPEVRERACVVIIERTVDRDAVELITDLVIARTMNVEDLTEPVIAR